MPRYAREIWQAKQMFDWAHVLHRQIYDVYADDRLSEPSATRWSSVSPTGTWPAAAPRSWRSPRAWRSWRTSRSAKPSAAGSRRSTA